MSGPAVPKLQGSAYFGASSAREFAQWNAARGSADADLLPALPTLVARTRDLDRNHGIASGAIQTTLDNVVGTGPRLAATPDYRALGRDKEWAEEWSLQVEAYFREWWNTTACDAGGQLTGRAQTTQIFRSGLLNGEALVLPIWASGAKWSTQFLRIEADRLSTPHGQLDSDRLRGGIEMDQYGRPLAYWIQKRHPGDVMGAMGITESQEWERIPATMPFGRKRVLHIHDQERTGQSRGRPFFSAVIGQFRMLDHYQRTELQSAVVNAMISAFIETPMDAARITELLGTDLSDEKVQEYMRDQRELIAPLKGAAVLTLPPGSKLSPFMPSRPNDAFAPFVEAVIRHIGAGLGLPLELLLKDFSKTNYSSARAALLEAWRFFAVRRQWLTECWLNPAYLLWLEEAVGKGIIDAPGFYQNQYAYSSCKWIWPGRGWVDPVKEGQASMIRIKGGLSTFEQECAEQGLDWMEVFDQQKTELEYRRRIGLPDPPDVQFVVVNEPDRQPQEATQ